VEMWNRHRVELDLYDLSEVLLQEARGLLLRRCVRADARVLDLLDKVTRRTRAAEPLRGQRVLLRRLCATEDNLLLTRRRLPTDDYDVLHLIKLVIHGQLRQQIAAVAGRERVGNRLRPRAECRHTVARVGEPTVKTPSEAHSHGPKLREAIQGTRLWQRRRVAVAVEDARDRQATLAATVADQRTEGRRHLKALTERERLPQGATQERLLTLRLDRHSHTLTGQARDRASEDRDEHIARELLDVHAVPDANHPIGVQRTLVGRVGVEVQCVARVEEGEGSRPRHLGVHVAVNLPVDQDGSELRQDIAVQSQHLDIDTPGV